MLKKSFYQTEKMVVLNFTQVYCKSATEVLNSECFKMVFGSFVDHLVKHNKVDLVDLLNLVKRPKLAFIELFKLIHTFKYEEIVKIAPQFKEVLKRRELLYQLTEDFYDYWRKLERYSVIVAKKVDTGLQKSVFRQYNEEFTNTILKTYRSVSEKVYNHQFSVYRQLPAGVNASILISRLDWASPDSLYKIFNNVGAIESVLIRPPFISYSAKNKRTGVYKEVFENPLKNVQIKAEDYLCYPCKVGSALTYVYFNKQFMAHGITISNLFEFASSEEVENRKPDLIYLFGYGKDESAFYYDEKENIYVGIAPLDASVDYFGYMKKMLLTLYNVKMIKEGGLPIHGACVHFKLKNKKEKTVVIIGDSGAGKSETLAALSECAGDNIISMHTIFDDMGTFKINDNKVMAYGTEIGAFVRLDDMSSDYAYREMDRAIFMNPDKINARLVIPVSTYLQIMHGYKIDMVLYANNYDDSDEIKFFTDKEEALNCFIRGARKAKGTTGEIGLVESFFANPFGPVQKEAETRVLLDKYFSKLFKDNIKVGEIYTRLAVDGYEHEGPEAVSKKLFKLLME